MLGILFCFESVEKITCACGRHRRRPRLAVVAAGSADQVKYLCIYLLRFSKRKKKLVFGGGVEPGRCGSSLRRPNHSAVSSSLHIVFPPLLRPDPVINAVGTRQYITGARRRSHARFSFNESKYTHKYPCVCVSSSANYRLRQCT